MISHSVNLKETEATLARMLAVVRSHAMPINPALLKKELGSGWSYFSLRSLQTIDGGFTKLQLVTTYRYANALADPILYFFLLLRDQQGKLELMPLSTRQHNGFRRCFLKLGCVAEHMFARTGVTGPDWSQRTQRAIYQQFANDPGLAPDTIYSILHRQIIATIKLILDDCAHYHFVEAGCGSGRLIKQIEQAFPQHKFAAFDINRDNILDCQRDYQGKIHFFNGDINQFASLPSLPKGNKIVIASGLMTRLVMPDAFTALDALIAISSDESVQFILGGGLGESLFTPYLCKQLAFVIAGKAVDQSANFFSYQRMGFHYFIKYKQQKLMKKNLLDLSFHPHPERILHALHADLKSDSTIDLSYCRYNSALQKLLDILLVQYPHLQLIFQHHRLDLITQFSQHFVGRCPVKAAVHVARTNEAALFGFFRRYPRTLPSPSKHTSLYSQYLQQYYGSRPDHSLFYESFLFNVMQAIFPDVDFMIKIHEYMDSLRVNLYHYLLLHYHEDVIDYYGEDQYRQGLAAIHADFHDFQLCIHFGVFVEPNELILGAIRYCREYASDLQFKLCKQPDIAELLFLFFIRRNGIWLDSSSKPNHHSSLGYANHAFPGKANGNETAQVLRAITTLLPNKAHQQFMSEFIKHMQRNNGQEIVYPVLGEKTDADAATDKFKSNDFFRF